MEHFSDYCGVQTGHPDLDGRNTLGRAHRSQGLVFARCYNTGEQEIIRVKVFFGINICR
jgi:hypothetical protein